jgi:hypothetical protein
MALTRMGPSVWAAELNLLLPTFLGAYAAASTLPLVKDGLITSLPLMFYITESIYRYR